VSGTATETDSTAATKPPADSWAAVISWLKRRGRITRRERAEPAPAPNPARRCRRGAAPHRGRTGADTLHACEERDRHVCRALQREVHIDYLARLDGGQLLRATVGSQDRAIAGCLCADRNENRARRCRLWSSQSRRRSSDQLRADGACPGAGRSGVINRPTQGVQRAPRVPCPLRSSSNAPRKR
jgi:hypothetical protein